MDGYVNCKNGKLVCIREERLGKPGNMQLREEKFESIVTEAVIEQGGPIRCVVKVSGKHESLTGTRRWLPFTLRFYFYKGQCMVRMVHSFIYDGDKESDFIKGLGITFTAPLKGEYYNRHVRLSGDTGFFSEAVQLLSTWRPRIPVEIYKKQILGEVISLDNSPEIIDRLGTITSWDSYKLVQITSETYRIEKGPRKAAAGYMQAADEDHAALHILVGSMAALPRGSVNFGRNTLHQLRYTE